MKENAIGYVSELNWKLFKSRDTLLDVFNKKSKDRPIKILIYRDK